MFQPLLDAYIESCEIDEVSYKPPLNIAVANWWSEDSLQGFKEHLLYFILSQYYEITLHKDFHRPTDIVFGVPNGATRNILSYHNTKRFWYSGENEVVNFNLFDYAIGCDNLEFGNRYLRVPTYYLSLHYINLFTLCRANDDTPYKTFNSPYTKKDGTHFREEFPNLYKILKGQADPFKRGFVSFVSSNKEAPIRNAFYDALSCVDAIAGGG